MWRTGVHPEVVTEEEAPSLNLGLRFAKVFQLQHAMCRLAFLLHSHVSCPQGQHPPLLLLGLGSSPLGLMLTAELPAGHGLNYPGEFHWLPLVTHSL